MSSHVQQQTAGKGSRANCSAQVCSRSSQPCKHQQMAWMHLLLKILVLVQLLLSRQSQI